MILVASIVADGSPQEEQGNGEDREDHDEVRDGVYGISPVRADWRPRGAQPSSWEIGNGNPNDRLFVFVLVVILGAKRYANQELVESGRLGMGNHKGDGDTEEKVIARISQYAVESHGTPVGESTKTHPGTGRSTRYYLEGRSEVTMKVQVLQEKAPNGG